MTDDSLLNKSSNALRSPPTGAPYDDPNSSSLELSSRNTGLAFQRTRLSAERTLMSVIRTSLSLIGFGFTIYLFFANLQQSKIISGTSHVPRNFGAVLVYLGVGIILVGIIYHVQFMLAVRHARNALKLDKLIHAKSPFPPSYTLFAAIIVLLVGLAVIASVSLHIGPLECRCES